MAAFTFLLHFYLISFLLLYIDLNSSTFDSYAGILLKLTCTHGTLLLLVAADGSWHLLSALVLRHYYPLTRCALRFPDFGGLFDQCFPTVIHSLVALSDSVSNGPFIVTSCCCLKCSVYFVMKQLHFVLFLTENKRENKEPASQIKQHWPVWWDLAGLRWTGIGWSGLWLFADGYYSSINTNLQEMHWGWLLTKCSNKVSLCISLWEQTLNIIEP